jgi:hypothetical protein
MAKSKTTKKQGRPPEPADSELLTYYSELTEYLQDFAAGRYAFLWLTGRSGTGKTEAARTALQGRDVLFRRSGQLTPLGLYRDLYEHLGMPAVLDDVEELLDEPQGRKLIAALGDTTAEKELTWSSEYVRRLEDLPTSFKTTSMLCIIANETARVPAIANRAQVLNFDPDNREVHQYAARWFWDQEIHDYIGQHMGKMCLLSARVYIKTWEHKAAGRNWKHKLLRYCSTSESEGVVQDLEADPSHPSRESRQLRFTALGLGSRATYHRILKELTKVGRLCPEGVGRIVVQGTRPPRATAGGETTARPPDLAARDNFAAAPITGGGAGVAATAPPASMAADDSVGFERKEDDEDDS